MKSPLPKRLPKNHSLEQNDITINQFITYLAELTEVVEGKPSAPVYQSILPASALKEQLLVAIKEKYGESDAGDDRVHFSDIRAIINRLIP